MFAQLIADRRGMNLRVANGTKSPYGSSSGRRPRASPLVGLLVESEQPGLEHLGSLEQPGSLEKLEQPGSLEQLEQLESLEHLDLDHVSHAA